MFENGEDFRASFLNNERYLQFRGLGMIVDSPFSFFCTEGSSMVETTLGIMTFFEWAFALASLSKGPNFAGFLHQGTEAQGRIKAPQAKQF